MYVCIGLLVVCGTLACVYISSSAGVTVSELSYIMCGVFFTHLVILMLVESRAVARAHEGEEPSTMWVSLLGEISHVYYI